MYFYTNEDQVAKDRQMMKIEEWNNVMIKWLDLD